MRKIVIIALLMSLCLTSCADELKRQKYLEKAYPNCKVEPATGMIKEKGYDYLLVYPDNQMVGVSFYPGSENKIMGLRNVR